MQIKWKVNVEGIEPGKASPWAVELASLEAFRQIAEELRGIREELAGLGVERDVHKEVCDEEVRFDRLSRPGTSD